MAKRVKIVRGVLKGTTGKVVYTNDKDRYGSGKSYRIQTDDGEIISPVDANDVKPA